MAKTSIQGGNETGRDMRPLAALVVIVLIAVGAYLILTSGPEPTPPAEVDESKQILQDALDAVSSVNEQSFELSGFIRTATRTVTVEVPFTGEGQQDIDAQRLYFMASVELPELGLFEGGEQVFETYIIGDDVYASAGAGWVKVESEEPIWAGGDQLLSPTGIVDMLSTMESDLVGSATINGRDAYEIELVPNIDKLVQQLQSVQVEGVEPLTPLSQAGVQELKDSIEEVKATMWIDKANDMPLRAELSIKLEFPEPDVELGTVGQLDVDLLLTIDNDFTSPVDIVLPAEALEAEVVGAEGF